MGALKIEIKDSVIGIASENGEVAESLKVYTIDGTFVEEIKVDDAETSLAHLKKGGYVIALDVAGKTHVTRFYRD